MNLLNFSHTSGRPVHGNGHIRMEVRDPLGTLNPNITYDWPYVERSVEYVSQLPLGFLVYLVFPIFKTFYKGPSKLLAESTY